MSAACGDVCDHCRPEFLHHCVRPTGHKGYHGCDLLDEDKRCEIPGCDGSGVVEVGTCTCYGGSYLGIHEPGCGTEPCDCWEAAS